MPPLEANEVGIVYKPISPGVVKGKIKVLNPPNVKLCITGIENVMVILRDGELVEVNTTKGLLPYWTELKKSVINFGEELLGI